MAARYQQGFSTAAILYNVENGLPRVSDRDGEIATLRLPRGINHPINICSSSYGLVAIHDPISNIYYIGNPGVADSYIPLPQTPRPHDPQCTHVVLATCLGPPAYHLICAVERWHPTRYTFDVYRSDRCCWFSYTRIEVQGHIIPNTGVSCGAHAFWLTEAPRSMTRISVHRTRVIRQVLIDNVVPPVPETRIQLGRIGNRVVLISVSVEGTSDPMVTLFFLQDHPLQWHPYSAYLPIPNPSRSIPTPIRFHSDYVEVFFWANGRLMIWENNQVDRRSMNVRMLNEEGLHVADGIAYVMSGLRPQNNPLEDR